MTAAAADRPANGRAGPTRLSTEAVVAAAVTIVDTVGAARFTMRELGAALGVEAMSVYRYFPSRRAILDAVVDAVGVSTAVDLTTECVAGGDWRAYLREFAHHQRRLALSHPELFLLRASHPTAAPWLRPPIRTVVEVDAFALRLAHCRFSPTGTVAAYRQFTAFLLGYLMCEATAQRSARQQPDFDASRQPAGPAASEVVRAGLAPPRPDVGGPVQRGEQDAVGGVPPASTDHGCDVGGVGSATRAAQWGRPDPTRHPHAAVLVRPRDADTQTLEFESDLNRVLDEIGLRRAD